MSDNSRKNTNVFAISSHNSDRERKNVTEFLKEAYASGAARSLDKFTESSNSIQSALKSASGVQGLLKPGYSRSAVTYIERDDPKRKHCEQIILTLNLSEAELQYPLNSESDQKHLDDGRSLRRFCWDSAVNVLSEELTKFGLRPKSIKNDRNTCKVTMQKEYLVAGDTQPDEYYSLEMEYLPENELESKKIHYVRTLARFAMDIEERKQMLYSRWVPESMQRRILADIDALETKRSAFMASNPDPREIDAGLVLHVEMTSTRETAATKNSMQRVISEFIQSLSRVAGGHVRLVYNTEEQRAVQSVAVAHAAGPASSEEAA